MRYTHPQVSQEIPWDHLWQILMCAPCLFLLPGFCVCVCVRTCMCASVFSQLFSTQVGKFLDFKNSGSRQQQHNLTQPLGNKSLRTCCQRAALHTFPPILLQLLRVHYFSLWVLLLETVTFLFAFDHQPTNIVTVTLPGCHTLLG